MSPKTTGSASLEPELSEAPNSPSLPSHFVNMLKSGVQLEVLRLFRGFLKEVRRKTPESRDQFRKVIYARFYQDAKLPKCVSLPFCSTSVPFTCNYSVYVSMHD